MRYPYTNQQQKSKISIVDILSEIEESLRNEVLSIERKLFGELKWLSEPAEDIFDRMFDKHREPNR